MKKLIYCLVSILLAVNFASAQDLPEGLVAYYPFDGDANNQAADLGHGTVVGAVLTEDRKGNPNSAYLFSGETNVYVEISDYNLVLPMGAEPRTLAAWVRCDDLNLEDGHVLVYGTQTNGQHCHLSIHMFGGFVRMGFWYNDIDAYADIYDSTWYHIASVWDGSKVSIYVDGELKENVAPTSAVNTTDHETIHLRIGCQNSANCDNAFPGAIDEVMIFSRALDGTEIATIMNLSTRIDNENDMQVSSFKLFQNYPNPFNPITKIEYEIPGNSKVCITVFDINGRIVKELINNKKRAGVHEITFDGANLSSGVYFYRIQAGDFVQTKRMLLIK